jgi:serine protease
LLLWQADRIMSSPRLGHLFLSFAAVLAAACSQDGEREPHRPPGGVGDKVVIQSPRGPAIADELVIRLAPALGAADQVVRDLVAPLGGQVVWRGPRTGAYLVRFDDAPATVRALVELAGRAEVDEVTRHLIAEGSGFSTSPGRSMQWNLDAMTLDPAKQWSGAEGVLVSVLDTGVAYEDHADALGSYALAPDLSAVEFVPGYDFVNDDPHANDDHGHGTHVTGVIASSGELIAIAPGASIQPIKVLGADNLGSELALAEALLLAGESGAQVINLSLSFSPAYFPSRFLQEAVDTASASGAVLVAAVGNGGGEIVTYPAAFREVIAVGASALDPSFQPSSGPQRWQRADLFLERAPYSNRGFALDVVAPGGRIDADLDGDGNPEAILAQSFRADPTEFEYLYYAGTSQAAAQVSGLAAAMRDGSEIDARQIRALIGESAARDGEPLSAWVGRGFVRGHRTLVHRRSALATRERPRLFSSVRLTLREEEHGRIAHAVVEVVDDAGQATPGAVVYGTFTGGVFAGQRATTDADGRAELISPPLDDPRVVAFQVDGVAIGSGPKLTVERPGGFVRIDSCSLGLMAEFGDALASGTGFSTSPGAPISLRLPATGEGEVASVLLANFSWSGATPAMAVVADAGWYSEAYPDHAVTEVVSLGSGLKGSPLRLDAGQSFSIPFDDVEDECVDLMVQTFTGSGFSTSPGAVPILPDPDGSCTRRAYCDGYRAILDALWRAEITSSEPGLFDSAGVSEAELDHLRATVHGYVSFGSASFAAPVAEYGETLEAAGIGLTPGADGSQGNLGAGSATWRE